MLEETEEGLLLRRDAGDKLSWRATYKAMAAPEDLPLFGVQLVFHDDRLFR